VFELRAQGAPAAGIAADAIAELFDKPDVFAGPLTAMRSLVIGVRLVAAGDVPMRGAAPVRTG